MPKFSWIDRQQAVEGAAKELNNYIKRNNERPTDAYIAAVLSEWCRRCGKNVAEMSFAQQDRFRANVMALVSKKR